MVTAALMYMCVCSSEYDAPCLAWQADHLAWQADYVAWPLSISLIPCELEVIGVFTAVWVTVCVAVPLWIAGFQAAGRDSKTAVGHGQVFTRGACVGVATQSRITNVYAPRSASWPRSRLRYRPPAASPTPRSPTTVADRS